MVSLLSVLLIYNYCTFVQTVPVTFQQDDQLNVTEVHAVNMSSVCVYNDVIYPSGKNFTTDDPCEICTCNPPNYTCEIQTCDVNPGCKAVQMADVCCPEYVCECENNGKIYGNGEKVEEPNPCKVCYCSGGQIKCVFITCYFRDDCKPIYVKGRCCPKYDHCPPLETMKNRTRTAEPTAVRITDLVERPQIVEEPSTNETVPKVTHRVRHPSVPTLEVIEILPTESVRGIAPFEVHEENQVYVGQQESASDYIPDADSTTDETVSDLGTTEISNSSDYVSV